jgi:hypothetical protein
MQALNIILSLTAKANAGFEPGCTGSAVSRAAPPFLPIHLFYGYFFSFY